MGVAFVVGRMVGFLLIGFGAVSAVVQPNRVARARTREVEVAIKSTGSWFTRRFADRMVNSAVLTLMLTDTGFALYDLSLVLRGVAGP